MRRVFRRSPAKTGLYCNHINLNIKQKIIDSNFIFIKLKNSMFFQDLTGFLKKTMEQLLRAGTKTKILLAFCLLAAFFALHGIMFPPDYNGLHLQRLDKDDRVFRYLVRDIGRFKDKYSGQGGFSPEPGFKVVFYRLRTGDNLWQISQKTGLSMDALLSMNRMKNVHLLSTNQEIRIPNKEGILYRTRTGETLESIAEKFAVSRKDLVDVNEWSGEPVLESRDVFIPNGKLGFEERQNILGMFLLPSRGRITSGFGWRRSPLSRGREFHTGIDIANLPGTPVLASQAGRVIFAGAHKGYGNLVILQHANGYSTRYGHLSRIRVKYGSRVRQGDVIGAVGSTGRATGAHLHFEIRKYGQPLNPYFLMAFSRK